MNHDRSSFTHANLTVLENCSEESVYAPGFIQSYGLIFALQEPHLKILQVSQNVQSFLGLEPEVLWGQPLDQFLVSPHGENLLSVLPPHPGESSPVFELKFKDHRSPKSWRLSSPPLLFRSSLHRTVETILLELEPIAPQDLVPPQSFYPVLQSAIAHLRHASSLLDLAQTLAQDIKQITGFDRVMIYRFEADDHGVVIAEEKEQPLESFLGLHYPAFDIPVPARQLFLRHWVRHIPDVQAPPSPLMPLLHPVTDQPWDLSTTVLRGVSPYHTEYLQNMGVAASLTISLIDDQRLWGLIACHHDSPRWVDYETRKTCEFLGQFASIELVRQQERELKHYRQQVNAIQESLQQAFLQDPHLIVPVLTDHAAQLLDLVHAEGAAIVFDQHLSLIGQTPSLSEVQSLLDWLFQSHQLDLYETQSLPQVYPPAQMFKQIGSGLLQISIGLNQKSYHLLWFRPEQIQTVTWAGNPQDAVVTNAIGNLHLCPRKSFEQWKEIVQETSLPWTVAELEAARMMRNTLMLAVLEFSQAALAQAAERAAIANQAKSQFLAKMSHELRTPLNAILGFTQLMNRSSDLPPEFQEHLGIINRSGEYLLSLINDVLEMSRIEAGQLVLTERYFNLHRLLRGMQDLFSLKAMQKGLTLTFTEDPHLPRYVCSDEAKLRQILINLISNAIKFTAQGGITVRVTTQPTAANPPGCTCYPDSPPPCQPLLLRIEVEDTGCGIDPRDWDVVFEAFMQTSEGRHIEGTGLGLPISRQFARLMGGDITVQSAVNRGATFTCLARIHQTDSLDLFEPELEPSVLGLVEGQPTYRILVVEDLPENQQLLVTLLKSIGFEVETANHGAEAIAQWQAWKPHLIFMDMQMPVMDGYEATRIIRQKETSAVAFANPPLSDHHLLPTKIVALTAYAFEDDRRATLAAGCDDYIAKPFTETALFEVIARHLSVQYRYAETRPNPRVKPNGTLTPQDLAQMPWEWREQVYEAALDLNDERIRQLLLQIPVERQDLIQSMTDLVDNFQLEAIALLTQN